MTASLDVQRKVAEQAEQLAGEVEVDTTTPRADDGLTAEESRRLIRLRYEKAIEALGRI